jgi:hypothetical protein
MGRFSGRAAREPVGISQNFITSVPPYAVTIDVFMGRAIAVSKARFALTDSYD